MKVEVRKRIALVVIAAVLSTAATCSTKRTPEGYLADYGVKIGKTVKVAQDAVGAVGTLPSAPTEVREGALAALKGLNVVNEKGLKLAAVLEQIAATRKVGEIVTPASLDEALKLLSEIDDEILLRVIPQLGNRPEVAAALNTVREISKLILTIQFGLGKESV